MADIDESKPFPDKIYIRQEGPSASKADVFDAATGERVTNVRSIDVTLDKNGAGITVTNSKQSRTYPIKDLTVEGGE